MSHDAENQDKTKNVEEKMIEISKLIQDGASTFLFQEYTFTGLFIIIFASLIGLTVEPQIGVFYTTGPFLLGAITSILSGYIAMYIAVRANVRTAK